MISNFNKALAVFKRRKRLFSILAFSLLAAGLTAFGLDFLLGILEKKEQSKHVFAPFVVINDETEDPALWGKNFPLQYEGYLKTTDQSRTRYGGSEALPRKPTESDPRTVVSQSRIDEDTRLKIMWDGYAFSKDFREERGHAYMLEDQLYTERQKVVQQPGACLNCHASTYTTMKTLGLGDLVAGFHKLNAIPYQEAKKYVRHPVACIDCHTPNTMQLRITRPAFMEGIRALKEREGIKDFDVNKMASHQEMRTFVCAQCHVEYYFKGKEKTLTFPWNDGIKADEILSYYEKTSPHTDWVHKQTGAKVLKAQHPEFELWSQGIHAKSSVSCTDCHMPYQRVGATKITDHHVRSPLLNVGRACQTCHRWSESELISRVENIQKNTQELRGVAMNALMEFIEELSVVSKRNPNHASLGQAREHQRKAQFLIDFIEAENSSGFHAPQEAMRILGLSLDQVRKGQNTLKK